MSEGEFHAYVALLAFSGLVLSIIAVRGFGLSMGARVVEGLFSVGFLSYATYLFVAEPAEFWIFYYAFAAPVWAVIHALRARKATRVYRAAPPVAAGYGHHYAPAGPQHTAAFDGGYPTQPATPAFDGGYAAQPATPAAGVTYQDAYPVAPASSYQDLPSGLMGAPAPAPQHAPYPQAAPSHPAYPDPAHPVHGTQPTTPGHWAPHGA
ncbi:hypothetical protein AB0J80_33660 [Actinoplanes sp. NPDC049548]|uniref:hypothetical protein n=1 Tax=Actinoplanes sp. NPDC049548 TaxID=3155152 RepID=UPI0034492A76